MLHVSQVVLSADFSNFHKLVVKCLQMHKGKKTEYKIKTVFAAISKCHVFEDAASWTSD